MSHPNVKIHESAYLDEPCEIGEGTAIWHFSHIREHTRIGRGCNIGQNCYVGKEVSIGDAVKLQNHVSVYERVELEDEVFCGPSCVFTNVVNPRAAIERKEEFKPTLVRRGATIGANATIVCGITIGRWAMIGAGACVRSNIPDFALVVGIPSRRIGWVSIHGDTLPPLVVGESWTCPVDGSRYQLESVNRLRLLTPEPPVKSQHQSKQGLA